MARTKIPASEHIVCDICHREVGALSHQARSTQEGRIRVTHHVLDYQGSPAAYFDRTIDACDECLAEVTNAINALAAKKRDHESEHE